MLGKVNHKNNFLWLQLQNAKKNIGNKKEKLLFPAKVIDDSKTAFLLVRYALLNSQVTDV